jgi:uncharacterized alkaline shock family protein YloU
MGAPSAAGGEAPRTATVEEPDADTRAAATLADSLAAATLACPDVVGLSGGLLGEVATYLPGRRITGVRVRDVVVDVHVVARYGPTMDEIGAQVRAALTPLAGDRVVAVTIDDLAVDPGLGSAHGPPSVRR